MINKKYLKNLRSKENIEDASLGLDFITALSGATTALANVGPGIGEIIGPAGNFSSLTDSQKIVLAVSMIVGRLEILIVMALFLPLLWKS